MQGALPFFIELQASDATVRARLAARTHEAAAVSDADWAVYLAQKAAWEPIDSPAWEHVAVSADGPREAAALEGLHTRLEPAGARPGLVPAFASSPNCGAAPGGAAL